MITTKTVCAAIHRVAAFLLVCVMCGNLYAAKTIRWRLAKGDQFQVALKQAMKQTFTTMDSTVEIPISLTVDMKWKVDSVDEDGAAKVTQTIERVRMSVTLADAGKLEYDSKAKVEPVGVVKQIAKAVELMIGAEFQQKMDDRGKVDDVVVPKKALAGLDGTPLLKQFFSGDSFKMMMTQNSPVLPKKAIDKGHHWTIKSDTKTPTGTMQLRSKYTYEGEEVIDGQSLDKFSVVMDLHFDGKDDKVNISNQKHSGAMYFNAVAGHLALVTMNQSFSIKVKVGDKDFDQHLKSSMHMSVKRVSNRKPN